MQWPSSARWKAIAKSILLPCFSDYGSRRDPLFSIILVGVSLGMMVFFVSIAKIVAELRDGMTLYWTIIYTVIISGLASIYGTAYLIFFPKWSKPHVFKCVLVVIDGAMCAAWAVSVVMQTKDPNDRHEWTMQREANYRTRFIIGIAASAAWGGVAIWLAIRACLMDKQDDEPEEDDGIVQEIVGRRANDIARIGCLCRLVPNGRQRMN